MIAIIALAAAATLDPLLPQPLTVDEVEFLTPQQLGVRVLGLAGSQVIERSLADGLLYGHHGDITFATRPSATDWGGLCQARLIDATFDADGASEKAAQRLSLRWLGIRTTYRLMSADPGAATEGVFPSSSRQQRNEACATTGPVLGSGKHVGFFTLACDWGHCETARLAFFAARTATMAASRFDRAGLVECKRGQMPVDYCSQALRRARVAIAEGFNILAVRGCRDAPLTTCVTGTLFDQGEGFAVSVEFSTGLPMHPESLLPKLATVTSVTIEPYQQAVS